MSAKKRYAKEERHARAPQEGGLMRIRSTGGRELCLARTGELGICICGESWSTEDWVALLKLARDSTRTEGPMTGVITFSPTRGPTAEQRAMASEDSEMNAVLRQSKRVVLLTQSLIARGALTAMSWFFTSVQMKTLAPHDARRGLTWIREEIPFDLGHATATLVEAVGYAGYDTRVLGLERTANAS
jgi:hypothetical protein